MPFKGLSTAKVARLVGAHPNTVRLYEQWGFIAPVPRSQSGYRLFTEAHVDQMRLARLVMGSPWVGRGVRNISIQTVLLVAAGDLEGALQTAHRHLDLVREERDQAESAANLLENWVQARHETRPGAGLRTLDAARVLKVTPDTMRNWERNGLVEVPRDPKNGYRMYTRIEIDRLRVVRMLAHAGYSLMAVLRMLILLDEGREEGLREVLDTPRPDEDAFSAADRWITSLTQQEERGEKMIELIEDMKAKVRIQE